MQQNYLENRGRGIFANSAIFYYCPRVLTNFTYIWTVLARKIKNMARLIGVSGIVNVLPLF